VNIEEFAESAKLLDASEVDCVALIAYFRAETEGAKEFALSELSPIYRSLDLPIPNWSRLGRNALDRHVFLRGTKPNTFRLHAVKKREIKSLFDGLLSAPKEAKSDSSIIPDSLLLGKRSYVGRFAAQINAAYTQGIFDGCAVLMRRLLEICLIHAYENAGLLSTIEITSGRCKDLGVIIADAEDGNKLRLTTESLACLDEFRQLGNLSAHRLYYNCRHEEIDRVKHKYRLTIEELLVKAGRHVEK
jgi:hypothetical protein